MITLHKISPNGAHLIWSIEKHLGSQLVIYWGQHGGVVQSKIDQVHVNLSGRTIDEQMELEMQSRISAQLDKGYRYTFEEAKEAKGKNALNLPRPMLAKVYDKQDLTSCFMQYKYNGHRCLITRQGDELTAYSRNGKIIETVGHILNDIDIPEGTTLDGELYIHGMALQNIGSLVRRLQVNSRKLKYIVYDQISNERFADRFEKLASYNLGSNVLYAATTSATNTVKIDLEHAKSMGFEGLIARQNNKSYEAGKRSDQLLKIKSRLDMEARVIAIEPSADGWAVLTCKFFSTPFNTSKIFKVVAPGTMEQKHEIYNNAALYIGKYVTVEFAEFTQDGLPFHPVAIGFRESE